LLAKCCVTLKKIYIYDINTQVMKAYRGGGSEVPLILDFTGGWRLGGPLEPLRSRWRRNKFVPLPVFKPWIVLPIVTILSLLSWLLCIACATINIPNVTTSDEC
jgi:hypothetical protein